jgi:hypothetical protein
MVDDKNTRQVESISFLLNQDPRPNGFHAWNWLGELHSGEQLSIYYDHRTNKLGHGDFVEIYDSQNLLGLTTPADDVVSIPILEIPKFFKRAE